MNSEAYLARQPILDRRGELFAYELLYRDPNCGNAIQNHSVSTAVVLSNLMNHFGFEEVVGTRRAFVKVDDVFLMKGHILSVPKEKFVFSLFDTIDLRPALIERIEELHGMGYRFAINDTNPTVDMAVKFAPVLKYIDYVKANMADSDTERSTEEYAWVKQNGLSFIATKVESPEIHQRCLEIGADGFQGYYFAQPELQQRDALSAEQMAVLEIWKLIMADAPAKALVAAFEQVPTLVIQLIKYLNSAAFSFKVPIKSIGQVLSLLGRMPLMQWLLLIIHARGRVAEGHSVLQSLLINRVETMVGLHRLMPSPASSEKEVYFVGLLSFIEVLFGIPIGKVLDELNVDDSVREALIRQNGELGALLSAARSIEHFDTEAIEVFVKRYGIAQDGITPLMLATMEKVNRFEAAL